MLLLAEQHDHCHWLDERRSRSSRVSISTMAADHPHRLVIGETLGLGDQDTVDHPVGEGQAQHFDRIVAGDAGRRPQRHRGGAAAGDDAPLGSCQLSEPLPGRLHELVQVYKVRATPRPSHRAPAAASGCRHASFVRCSN